MVKGNTFAYTVLAAFGFYYGGYGVMLMPSLGIVQAYGGETAEYHNAFAFYQLTLADAFTKSAGAFGFLSALAGFYLLAHGLCQDAVPFQIPLCVTSGRFRRASSVGGKPDEISPV
ncbi:uncharacterized protein N7484_002122 [Penicillium longicatenatum]|uniref:uncharacterized protein n=1 Tax=Penicillium longicatenatum TaxID=1561947 RepID=UPI0025487D48|nr:uncharacterized protein N7484_002122 [Penicillium longicatenatum]KAJ5658473.1 hypothetical protein N7484_002122 [Penicillium longicatenatum]